MATERVWYVGYGSNVNADRLRRYLTDEETAGRYTAGVESRWVQLDRQRLYFAGTSKTWGGAVAFCALIPQQARPYPGRAYALARQDLALVLARENGWPQIGWDISDVDMKVREWAPLPIALDADGFKGKYNALLRLPDVDGDPAYTVTTSHVLPLGDPAPEYLDTIAAGLGPHLGDSATKALLTQATARTATDNRGLVGLDATKTVVWTGPVSIGRSTGIPSIRLPTIASGALNEQSLRLGLLSSAGIRLPVWVSYSLASEDAALVSPSVAETIGLAEAQQQVIRLESALPVQPTRLPGYIADIPPPDVVHVDAALAEQLGRWALAVAPHFSGPVRVLARLHVPVGSVRVAYGLRTLLGLSADTPLLLTSLARQDSQPGQPDSGSGVSRRRVRRLRRALRMMARRFGELLLGAPTVTLRATEGLVGDDGRAVVRVDSTALDYLGVAAGDRVVLSWAYRSTLARVLLQTEETRQRMDQQLRESTGTQTRVSLTDPTSRTSVPNHLRVWVSPTVRHDLAIPPDTLVRLRRSLSHVAARNAATLSLPFAGLAVAALAVPDVPSWVWVIVFAISLALTLLPVRLVEGRSSRPRI